MTVERRQRIRELKAEIEKLQAEEDREKAMIEAGYTPLGNGAYRVPSRLRRYE